jgi:hypothetical protein
LGYVKLKFFDLFIRRYVIRNLFGIISILGDYVEAQNHYKISSKHLSAIYPHALDLMTGESKDGLTSELPQIMVGHSASRTNEHIEVFELLKLKYRSDFQVFCPLSYGDMEYAKEVIAKGKELFGQNFSYLDSFVNDTDYNKILSKISIAIFNCKRQASIGNLSRLVALNKKVYFHRGVVPFEFYLANDILLEDLTELDSLTTNELFSLNDKKLKANAIAIRKLYDSNNVANMWEDVFKAC